MEVILEFVSLSDWKHSQMDTASTICIFSSTVSKPESKFWWHQIPVLP